MNTLTGAPSEQYYDATARPYKVRRVDGFEITDLDSDIVSFTNGLLQLKESSAPPAPPPDKVAVYAKEGALRVIDSAGTDTELGAGGGGGPFAPVDHTHETKQITDFNDAVNGLVESNNNIATSQIVDFVQDAVTAAETSKAFALTEHKHETKEITDFTQGVINVTDPRYATVSRNVNPIPLMTSNTTPTPYSVQESSFYVNPNTGFSIDEGYRLFDQNPNTNWHSALLTYAMGVPIPSSQGKDLNLDNVSTPGQWVTCQLPTAVAITGYTMTPRTDIDPTAGNGQPLHWYIVYSSDGVLWHAADRVTLASKLLQPTTYELPVSVSTRHVGILIDKTADERDYTAFGDLAFTSRISHTHTTNDITDFAPGVNTLITSNTDAMAHTHTASQITDFTPTTNSLITSHPTNNYGYVSYANSNPTTTNDNSTRILQNDGGTLTFRSSTGSTIIPSLANFSVIQMIPQTAESRLYQVEVYGNMRWEEEKKDNFVPYQQATIELSFSTGGPAPVIITKAVTSSDGICTIALSGIVTLAGFNPNFTPSVQLLATARTARNARLQYQWQHVYWKATELVPSAEVVQGAP